MEFKTLPTYSDIFENEEIPSKSELINSISTEGIVHACCHINAVLHFSENRLQSEIEIFLNLISRVPDAPYLNRLRSKLFLFIKNANSDGIYIFPILHSLKLIEESILNYSPGSYQDVTPEQELSILRLLLIYNTDESERLGNLLIKIKGLKHESRLYPFFWSSLLPISTFLRKKDYLISLYKSIKFLEFLKEHHSDQLSNYLQLNDCTHPNEIPYKLFLLMLNGYDKQAKVFSSFYHAKDMVGLKIMDQLSLNLGKINKSEYLKNDYHLNFKGIRSYPFMKYLNEDIGISNWKFVIEKFYDGLIFDFHNKSGIKQIKGYASFGDYKSKLGQTYSNDFFMQTMKNIFARSGWIALKEEERNKDCNYDFYIRFQNHVFILEFKDNLFPLSENFEEIKTTLDKKIIEEKGVSQLVDQIIKLSNNPKIFDEFEEFDNSRLFVYPIIVYTDYSFGMPGISHYINTAFDKKLSMNIKSKFFSVNPITLIDFDFFLENYDEFKNGELSLVKILNSYFQKKRFNFEIQQKFPSTQNMLAMFDGFDALTKIFRTRNSNVGYISDYVMDKFMHFAGVNDAEDLK